MTEDEYISEEMKILDRHAGISLQVNSNCDVLMTIETLTGKTISVFTPKMANRLADILFRFSDRAQGAYDQATADRVMARIAKEDSERAATGTE